MRVVCCAVAFILVFALGVFAQSDTYIKGTVTDPNGQPLGNISINAEICTTGTDGTDLCSLFNVVTDSVGGYVLYFPAEFRNKPVSVEATDVLGSVTGATAPAVQELTIVDSLLGIDFQFKKASTGNASVFVNVDIAVDDIDSLKLELIDNVTNKSYVSYATMPNPDVTLDLPSGVYTAILTICYISTKACVPDTVLNAVVGSGQITFFVSEAGLTVPEIAGVLLPVRKTLLSKEKSLCAIANGTMLVFKVASTATATLELFDMKARHVATLLTETVYPGSYQIRIHDGLIGRGTYVAQLKVKGANPYKSSALVNKTR